MNPHKGEVELKAGDRTLILRFSVDALCRLEAATGKGFPVLAAQMADPTQMTITLLREVLRAGLHQHNPVTIEEAGDLIPEAGGMIVIMKKVSEALDLAFPQAEGDKPSRPPAAPRRVGTGRRS